MLHYCLAALPSGFNSTTFPFLLAGGFCWLVGFAASWRGLEFWFYVHFDVVCDISLTLVYYFETLVCSALSNGFFHLLIIYTAPSIMSEQLLEQQEHFSVQHIVNKITVLIIITMFD